MSTRYTFQQDFTRVGPITRALILFWPLKTALDPGYRSSQTPVKSVANDSLTSVYFWLFLTAEDLGLNHDPFDDASIGDVDEAQREGAIFVCQPGDASSCRISTYNKGWSPAAKGNRAIHPSSAAGALRLDAKQLVWTDQSDYGASWPVGKPCAVTMLDQVTSLLQSLFTSYESSPATSTARASESASS
jgi:hypothetical protein